MAPRELPAASDPALPKGHRTVFWDGGARETPVFDALTLAPNQSIDGPALVEAPDTVHVVDAGWRLFVDRFGNFVIRNTRSETPLR